MLIISDLSSLPSCFSRQTTDSFRRTVRGETKMSTTAILRNRKALPLLPCTTIPFLKVPQHLSMAPTEKLFSNVGAPPHNPPNYRTKLRVPTRIDPTIIALPKNAGISHGPSQQNECIGIALVHTIIILL